jgi:GNAT superfamily N-acetyltransferase
MNPLVREVEIRRATVADVPEMAESRSGDPVAGPADSRMAAYLDGRHHPQQALAPRVAYLATVSEKVVGYVAGHLSHRYGCEGEVQYLYVAPAHRRAGVASALLRELAQWFVLQGVARICVDVNAESPGGAPFYAHHGARRLRPHWLSWPDISTVFERPK